MKKISFIIILAAVMLIGGNAQAQGKKKIRITYRSAKRLVEKIEANPNAETLYLSATASTRCPRRLAN